MKNIQRDFTSTRYSSNNLFHKSLSCVYVQVYMQFQIFSKLL